MTTGTHPQGGSVCEATLYVALELSRRSWVVAMTTGLAAGPWVQTMAPGDWSHWAALLKKARQRFGLPATARVVSCYEAGRDGFWIHRALTTQGVENHVIDSASIEVNRRARRNKTDRIDARKLVRLLVRVGTGEREAWREVRVPAPAVEAARHRSRERPDLVAQQTRLINQLRSWLATVGAALPKSRRPGWWEAVRDWSGTALPAELQARLARTDARLRQVATQIAELEHEQRSAGASAEADSAARRLRRLKGLGVTTVATALDEGLLWREFRNRREVGGLLGFAPTHYASGDLAHDRGISQAGNRRLQAVMVEAAWNWVRWQPSSALTQWYRERFAGARGRRLGIVAVARKLLIALWRCATTGAVPAGAVVKPA